MPVDTQFSTQEITEIWLELRRKKRKMRTEKKKRKNMLVNLWSSSLGVRTASMLVKVVLAVSVRTNA